MWYMQSMYRCILYAHSQLAGENIYLTMHMTVMTPFIIDTLNCDMVF